MDSSLLLTLYEVLLQEWIITKWRPRLERFLQEKLWIFLKNNRFSQNVFNFYQSWAFAMRIKAYFFQGCAICIAHLQGNLRLIKITAQTVLDYFAKVLLLCVCESDCLKENVKKNRN